MATGSPEQHSETAIGEQLQELTETIRHAMALLERISAGTGIAHQESKPLPDFARVKVAGKKGVAAEVTGRTGVILGRSLDRRNEWLYTVLVDSVNETYLLPQESLHYLNEVVPENQVYSGSSLTVRVDKSGVSRVRRRAPRRKRR